MMQNKTRKRKGFSLIELVVVIAILAILAAIFVPSLLRYTEDSRAQKDVSAMDEVINAVQLAMTDTDCFDEMLKYSCNNNFITYTDSSGKYGQQVIDAEYWAPDGYGKATTITFNPEYEKGKTIYRLENAVVNDMAYGNGSVAPSRVMEGAKAGNPQCLLQNAKLSNVQQSGYMYNKIRSIVGADIITTSQTYRNSSFTIFIKFNQYDELFTADVTGAFNGTNLEDGSVASVGSGTNSEVVDHYTGATSPGQATTPAGGTTNANFHSNALAGSGSTGTKDYMINSSTTSNKTSTLSCEALGDFVNSKKPKHIKFITAKATGGTDVSVNNDKSILAWMEGDTCLISTSKNNAKVCGGARIFFDGQTYSGYKTVETIDVSGLDASNCGNFVACFRSFGSSVTTHVAIYGLNTWSNAKAYSHSSMFRSFAYSAQSFELDASVLDVSNSGYLNEMFWDCGYRATDFNVGDLGKWNTSNVSAFNHMFCYAGYDANTWSVGDIGKWNTSNATSMSYMFHKGARNANNVDIGDLSGWDTSKVTNMQCMFYDWRGNSTDDVMTIKGVGAWDVSKVTSMYAMFDGFGRYAKQEVTLDLSNWRPSSATDMSFMFSMLGQNAKTMNLGDLDNWTVGKCKLMFNMFSYCGATATSWNIGDLSNWDTSSVVWLSHMFSGISRKFEIGDISNWNVSKCVAMRGMFTSSQIKYVGDISKWNTSSCKDMAYMFYGTTLSEQTTLDLSNWNVDKTFRYYGFVDASWRPVKPPIWKLDLIEGDEDPLADVDSNGVLNNKYLDS